MSATRPITEEFQVTGGKLLQTVKNIVKAGNVRRIVVKNPQGKTVLDVPLTAGVVGAALLPFWAAIGGIAMLATRFTIVVEREPTTAVTPASPPTL
jgi:hypothetical protein